MIISSALGGAISVSTNRIKGGGGKGAVDALEIHNVRSVENEKYDTSIRKSKT